MIAFMTARLVVRYLRPADLDALHALCSDPDVMQWVGDGTPLSRTDCERWIAVSQQNYSTRGFGNFAVVNRDTGEFMGYGGIVYAPQSSDAEIIYALARRHWRKGYATELTSALLDFASQQCGLKKVIATIAPENMVSRRIVERAGMLFQNETLDEDGLPMRVYVAEWPATQQAAAGDARNARA